METRNYQRRYVLLCLWASHSPDYRKTFSNDLKKMLPRIPLVNNIADFWSFSKAGKKLADLHLKYETLPTYTGINVTGTESKYFKVTKMKFPQKDQEGHHYLQ